MGEITGEKSILGFLTCAEINRTIMRSVNFLLFIISALSLHSSLYAQTDIIEIDSITGTASKVMPYNKTFTIRVPIDAEEVNEIHFIKKYKHFDLSRTISHYIQANGGSYAPQVIPANYYVVKKIGEKNFLFLTFADNYTLEPSASYFIIFTQKKLGSSVLGFFDNFYLSQYGPAPARPAALSDATESLRDFERSMRKIFGTLVFGYYTVASFTSGQPAFLASFNANLLAGYTSYTAAATAYTASLTTNSTAMAGAIPAFDSLTFKQLLIDTTINKDALTYLVAREMSFNNAASDINTVALQARIAGILNGSISLDCIFCTPVNVNSTTQADFNKRIANLDASVNLLNNLKRTLFLLQPKSGASSNITTSINNIITWITNLQTSKTDLGRLLKIRKGIEAKITDSVYGGFRFNYASLVSGNSYLNFETRNKVLLTPDFGIVTPAITKRGKTLDYGVVPYLGFHINLMAVDKDLPFNSYRKNFKQYFSVMVGWSLVNMQKDDKYENFFEKSSLLTGVGYRLNNVFRITAGTQWLFKLGKDTNGNPTKKLDNYPYLGLSFDLNVKQYLNGFVDLLSGIGKTKPAESSNPQ